MFSDLFIRARKVKEGWVMSFILYNYQRATAYQLEGLLITFYGCFSFFLLSRAHTFVIPVVSIPEYLFSLLRIETLP
jgi:hypothetical protein